MRLFLSICAALTLMVAIPAAAEDNSGFGSLFANETVAALNEPQGTSDEDAMLAAAAAFADIAPAAGNSNTADDLLPGEETAGAADYTPLPDSLADKYIGP
jgi:hypothetical protein